MPPFVNLAQLRWMEDSMLWNTNDIWLTVFSGTEHVLFLVLSWKGKCQSVNYHIVITLPNTNNALILVCFSSQGTLNRWIHVANMFALIWAGCCTMYQEIVRKMWRNLTAAFAECLSKWTLTAAAQNGNVHVSYLPMFSFFLIMGYVNNRARTVHNDKAIDSHLTIPTLMIPNRGL